jgi:membrane-anchored protein YejM (alkaline phosphatase superfamily)
MKRRSAATESVPLSANAEGIALCVSSVVLAVSLWLTVQRSHYLPLLAVAVPGATPEERIALPWTVCAQTVSFLAPGVLAATLAFWRGNPRLGRRVFLIYSTVLLVMIALDLELYVALGRHLAELARFALLPGAAQIAGDRGHWYWLVACWSALAALATSSATWAARRLVIAFGSRLSVGFRRALAALFLLIVTLSAVLPIFLGALYRHPAVREGLSAQLVWSPRLGATLERSSFQDPRWSALETGLRQSYTRVFPLVFAQHRIAVEASTPGKRPNVLLIVVESFRADAFTQERMPRVFAWAQQGLIAKQHFGGSTYSEAGAFSLLYGRSPLLFDFTLDTHQPPTWCEIAHRLGMDCSYYSGHPRIWMRREEFLNPQVVDHFVHDDTGNWNQWDRKALAHAVAAIKSNASRPAIATVLLMSTHFEYQYPPEYERHLPVLVGVKWSNTNFLDLGPSNRAPLTNRYLNSLAFTDDIVADAIAELAGTNTVIVLTGDHGESLGDDGRFGHGYSFADVLTHVPFAMVGPGVPAAVREAPSLHSDVLRTLVPLLGGTASGPAESQDLLAPAPPRESLLFAHCSYSHDFADALLVHDKLRIRLQLGLREPELRLTGANDALGHPASLDGVSRAQIAELLAAFEHELRVLWQPDSQR